MGSNTTRANYLYGIEKSELKMNTIYIGKYRHTPMITSQIKFETVANDEGRSPKLALSEGGSRGNIAS